jgi:eukaryotic-like serine/threonine-protein kinase
MTLQAGSCLGPYEILGPLGAGGMGEVYRARDTRLEREVAVKVLPERLTEDATALSRFEREAKALAALSHPNLVSIHDFGSDGDIAFAVMELLEGETLRARLIRSSPIPWREAVEIAIPLAEGLAAAHSRGVVHRDLKPENIFLTSDGRLKILDFGLARREPSVQANEGQTRSPTVTLQTTPGTVMGTVGYMAPEQVSGGSGDARSDIFSFGCVLYEIVAGARAFAGRTGAETLAAILRDDPPHLSASGPQVPQDLAAAIRHCLEKKPEQRFQSARDLAYGLRATLASSGSAAPAAVRAVRRSRPRRRILAAGLVLVALVLGGFFWRQRVLSGRISPIHSLAVLPLENLSGDADQLYFADGMTDELITVLSQIHDLRVVSRTSVKQYRGTKKTVPQIARELNVEGIVEGSVMRSGSRVTIKAHLIRASPEQSVWAESYERDVRDVLTLQSEAARAIARQIQVNLTPQERERLSVERPVNREAYEDYLKGRYHLNKDTLEDDQKSVEFFSRAIEKDPRYAAAYAGLSTSYASMTFEGLLPPADGLRKMEEAATKAQQLDDSLGVVHFALAIVRVAKWDFSAVEVEYRKAIEMIPQDADVHRFYGMYLRGVGRSKESVAEVKKARDLDPLGVENNRLLGAAFYWAGLYDEAIRQYSKTLELDPNNAPTRDGLADVYARKRMYKEAIAEERKYLSLMGEEESASRLERDFGTAGGGRGGASDAAAYERAMKNQYEKTLVLAKEASKDAYVSPMFFVFLYANLGDKDQAFAWLEKAYQERQPGLAFIKWDPQLEPLRKDPRFDDLLRRIGFPG